MCLVKDHQSGRGVEGYTGAIVRMNGSAILHAFLEGTAIHNTYICIPYYTIRMNYLRNSPVMV